MAEVTRGEIWQFAFPKPDRKRPVLVLTRATVPAAGLRSYVGVVPPETMDRVRDALLFALGFGGAPRR